MARCLVEENGNKVRSPLGFGLVNYFWLSSFLEASHGYVSKLRSHGFFQRSTHMEASVNIGLLGWFTSVSGVYFDTSGVFFVEKSVEKLTLRHPKLANIGPPPQPSRF